MGVCVWTEAKHCIVWLVDSGLIMLSSESYVRKASPKSAGHDFALLASLDDQKPGRMYY